MKRQRKIARDTPIISSPERFSWHKFPDDNWMWVNSESKSFHFIAFVSRRTVQTHKGNFRNDMEGHGDTHDSSFAKSFSLCWLIRVDFKATQDENMGT